MRAKKCAMFLAVVSCAFVFTISAGGQLQENAPWPMFHHDLRHSGLSAYTGPSNPVLLWDYPTEWWEGGSNGPILGSNGVIYVGSYNISALDSSGSLSWSYDIFNVWPSFALGSNGMIYGGAAFFGFYALNSNGSLVWSYITPYGTASSFALGSGGKLFAGAGNGNNRIFCFGLDGSLCWSHRTGGAVESSPAIRSDGVVFVGSNDYRLYAMNPDGSIIWSYRSGGRMYSSPAFGENDEIHIGTADDRSVYTFSSIGSLLWSYKTGGHVISSPAVDLSWRIYVGSNDRNMYALNGGGSLVWSYTTDGMVGSSPALGSDGMIYFGSKDGGKSVYALNSDGSLVWEGVLDGAVGSPAIGSDGRLYVKSQPNDYSYGAVFCIGQVPTVTPTPTGPTPTPTATPTRTPTPTITPTPTQVPWWDSGWNMRKKIDIGNAGPSTLTDFPAYIIVSREGEMQDDYDDLRFINSGSVLDYEIDNCDESSATVWVKIPEIPAAGTFTCMYYGNDGAGSGQNPAGVWSNDYAGVWHMGEAGGNISDSSGNGKTGSVNGTVNYHQSGKIGHAITNPATGHFVVDDNSFGENSDFTIEAWFRYTTDDTGGLLTRHDEWGTGGWIYGLRSGKATFGRSEQFIDSNRSINDGNWHYIVGALIQSNRQYIYIDGIQDNDGPVGLVTDTGYDMIFFDASSGLWKLRGSADEVRISTQARSADWIKQSYEMVENQATYVTFSEEEPAHTPTPTETPTQTPTATPTLPHIINLVPIKTVVSTGDTFALDIDIHKRIAGMGTLVGYLVVRTPEGAWFSLIPNKSGGFDIERSIKPAVSGAVIPSLHVAIVSQKITDSIARGDYRFAAAVFLAGDRITLENWRSKAIYSAEATITLR